MKNVLLVDDDPVIIRIYRDSLTNQGYNVGVASDGLEAVTSLRMVKPDLIILDLMMPRLSGADVLRYLRAQSDYASLPVIVFSNAYLNELGREAAKYGVARALLKVRCTPALLASTIADVFEGKPAEEDPAAAMLAIPTEEADPVSNETPDAAQNRLRPSNRPNGPRVSQAAAGPNLESPTESFPSPTPMPGRSRPATEEPVRRFPVSTEPPPSRISNLATPLVAGGYSDSLAKARSDFLENAPQTRIALGELLRSFLNAKAESERLMRLRDLYRKVHFITSMAGLADCPPVGQMASAFEALLFELMARPSLLSASPLATAKTAVDFLGQLLESAPELTFSVRLKARVLVVDDDRLSSRLFVASLQEAHLQARSTDDPNVALDWAGKEDFQLFLLDIEMPQMNGFDLCKQIRAMPKYESTPVVYVTSHTDFQSRSEGMLSGGNDLIAKPVLAPELAVKAVMHLLKNQLGL